MASRSLHYDRTLSEFTRVIEEGRGDSGKFELVAASIKLVILGILCSEEESLLLA